MPRLPLLLLVISCSTAPKGPDTLVFQIDKKTLLVDGKDSAAITVTASNANASKFPDAVTVTITASDGNLGGVAGQTSQTLTLANGTASTTFVCTKDKNITVTIGGSSTPGTGQGGDKIICGLGTLEDGSGMNTPASIKASAANPVIVTGGTTNLTATVVAVDGQPAKSGSVLFSTSLGTFGSGGGASQSVTIVDGKASLVLNAPSQTGTATITASYTDTLNLPHSTAMTVRIVAADEWSLVVDPLTEAAASPNQVRTFTATVYQGATTQASRALSVILSGPTAIGTLVSRNPGSVTSADGRSIPNVQSDDAGRVRVDFVSGVSSGAARVEFRFDPGGGKAVLSEVAVVNVTNVHAVSSAQFDEAALTDRLIRVQGSIAPNRTKLTFIFLNDNGDPVDDGTPVQFTLSKNVSKNVFVTPPETTTVGGRASCYLNAGGQAETVTVTATASSSGVIVSATSTSIAIVGGVPEWSHMSISCLANEIETAGLALEGLQTHCTVRVADRFSNNVDIGTQISFRAEGGRVNSTAAVNPADGTAVAVLDSTLPRLNKWLIKYQGATVLNPRGNGKIELVKELQPQPFSYANAPGAAIPTRPFPNGTEIAIDNYQGSTPLKYDMQLLRSRGQNTLLAITQGEETFIDANGNKIYDDGEAFIDLDEPFIDKNDNGIQDTCLLPPPAASPGPGLPAGLPTGMTIEDYNECYEDFIDLNGDNVWTPGNGRWDNYTLIWRQVPVTWTGPMSVDLYPLYTPSGSTYVERSADLYEDDGTPKTAYPDVNAGNYPAGTFQFTGAYLPSMQFRAVWGDENRGCDPRGGVEITAEVSGITSTVVTNSINQYGCNATISIGDGSATPRNPGLYAGVLKVVVKDLATAEETELGWGFILTVATP